MVFLFCKQKTAYEMRISDWSSDVCSSDLRDRADDRQVEIAEMRRKERIAEQPGRHPRGGRTQQPGADPLHRLHGEAHFDRARSAGHIEHDDRDRGGHARGKAAPRKTGRAAWRERVCQYVKLSVVAVV